VDYSTFGTNTLTRKKKAVVTLRSSDINRKRPRVPIGMPQDFRPVSSIIDVDILPESHRRVRLYRHGSDKPLGFYIRDGTSVRVTPHGLEKVPGIFISRMVPGGLAESTGLLAVNDEVLEVNGIEVTGKSLDQVTDMMIANSHNLIVTVKPVNQRNNVVRSSRISGSSGQSSDSSGSIGIPSLSVASAREASSVAHHSYHDDLESDEDTDIVIENSLKRPSLRSNTSLASSASRAHQQTPTTGPAAPPSPPTRPSSVTSNTSFRSQTRDMDHRVDRVGLLSPLEESSAEISRDSGIVSQSASSLSMVSDLSSSGTVSQSPSFGAAAAAANVVSRSPSLNQAAAEPGTADQQHDSEQDDEVLRQTALQYSSYIRATAGEEVCSVR
ncbi:hypothetical protein GOODEAATRI_001154, partial [Goodea atripinnis]